MAILNYLLDKKWQVALSSRCCIEYGGESYQETLNLQLTVLFRATISYEACGPRYRVCQDSPNDSHVAVGRTCGDKCPGCFRTGRSRGQNIVDQKDSPVLNAGNVCHIKRTLLILLSLPKGDSLLKSDAAASTQNVGIAGNVDTTFLHSA